MQSCLFTWRGVPLWISRSGYTGEDGFEISVPAADAALLADALCALPQVKPIGLGARDSLRLEAGLPLYGHDLTPAVSTIGADLGFAIQKRRREERSEEHTSELQSLMRISYAVFCLQNKSKTQH